MDIGQHKVYPYSELQTALIPPAEAIVDCLAYKGESTLLIGPQKSAKSLFAMQVAIAAATGTRAAQTWKAPKPVAVLYVGFEDTLDWYKEQSKRISAAMQVDPSSNLYIWNIAYLHINTDKGYQDLRQVVLATHPDLLVLDPLNRAHRGSLTNDDAVGTTTERLNALMHENGHATFMTHHEHRAKKDLFNKKVEEGRDAFFGSYLIAAWANALFGIALDKNAPIDKSATIQWLDERRTRFKSKFGERAELWLSDTPEALTFLPTSDTLFRSDERYRSMGPTELGRELGIHKEQARRLLIRRNKNELGLD